MLIEVTEQERTLILRLLDAAIGNTVFCRKKTPTFTEKEIESVFTACEKLESPISRDTDFLKAVAMRCFQHGKPLRMDGRKCADCGINFDLQYYDDICEEGQDLVCPDCLVERHRIESEEEKWIKEVLGND